MRKTIALVAHDHNKPDLVKWSLAHKTELTKYKLVATGTTGGIL
jgi:methylglyoxal synthase